MVERRFPESARDQVRIRPCSLLGFARSRRGDVTGTVLDEMVKDASDMQYECELMNWTLLYMQLATIFRFDFDAMTCAKMRRLDTRLDL